MKRDFAIPLLVKMLGWLVLHLLLLALSFWLFFDWQLRLGLDSLLSGATGERLGSLGEVLVRDLQSAPEAEWQDVLDAEAARRGVKLDLWEPHKGPRYDRNLVVPEQIQERFEQALPPEQRIPGRRPPMPRGSLPPGRGMPPPPPAFPGTPVADAAGPGAGGVRPVFLARGDSGDGYWAAIHLSLSVAGLPTPRHEVLMVRSDDLAGGGLFFDLKPWIFGGLAVLVLSLAFWTPVILGITRYLRRLTAVTEQIAGGDFDVRVRGRRNDELGRLGLAVEHMARRLDHLVTGQKRFLGDVAHELCSPLARLRTGLGILEQRLPEGQAGTLASIEEETEEMARLVEEVLAFTRASTRDRRILLKPVELRPLVELAAARECPGKVVSIEMPEAAAVTAEPKLLERAVGNLLRNCARHAGADARVQVVAARTNGNIRLSIADTGPGVPAAELERLFEPFYRPDAARTREQGGSGLGLAIVRSCVDACRGSVAARNRAGGGLVVEITLAAARGEATGAARPD